MEKKLISDLALPIVKDDWINFCAHKISDPKLIWFNSTDIDTLNFSELSLEDIKKRFLQENAYAIASNGSFQNVLFDENDKKLLEAERYGGTGIGFNGGGGRCGNTDKFQLKGVGANGLVGEGSDNLHSYGGLDASAAIIETINSYVFGKVLPLGVVKVHGLIWVEESAGFDITKNESCWGVLMVRDQCVRPAHLMRTANFKPKSESKAIGINDVARVRRINKKLSASLGEHNKFIMALGKFLQNQANQFGFARAARIMNGVISPSNCTFDGRWIDLNSCSMIDGGVNYSINSQFYTEHEAPLSYAIELLHSYGKYNNVYLNPEPLINYYREQFFTYFQHHISYVMGFSSQLSQQTSDEWKAIALCFYRVIHSGKAVVTDRAKFNSNDPVSALIKGLYLSLFSNQAAALEYDTAGIIDDSEKDALSTHFKILIENMFTQHKSIKDSGSDSLSQFIVTSFICAMKRACYSAIFYLPLLEGQVRKFCRDSKPVEIEKFINTYCDTANWIYERQESNIILFQSSHLTINMETQQQVYSIFSNNDHHIFKSYTLLMNFLHEELGGKLLICGFNGVYFFGSLLNILEYVYNDKEMLKVTV